MKFLDWLGLTTSREPVAVGDPAPEATAQDETGRTVALSDFYKNGTTLFYFFPKADTPGCTSQACHFRDDYHAILQLGVTIVGVSSDRAASQLKFKEKNRIPFTLLADPDRKVAQAFGVSTILGMTHRQSFLVRDGKIVWRDLKASTTWQAREIERVLAKVGT